jgi:ribosomal protein L24E
MVKDPYCEVYFPKRKGVPLKKNAEVLLFCSEECRDKFRSRKDAEDA